VNINSNIIDGKYFADKILSELELEIALIKKLHNIVPTLAIVLIGEDPASIIYVKNKLKAAQAVGLNTLKISLNNNIKTNELLAEIDQLNNNKEISSIIIQFPLPSHIDSNIILSSLNPNKDVDGFHPLNVGYLHSGLSNGFVPCTALGCLELIKQYEPDLAGKNVTIIGRSNIVGKPLAALLINENATITVCHSKTINLPSITYKADIVISAIGSPLFLKSNYFNQNAIVIDVGINRIPNSNKVIGDVDFNNVYDKVRYITPVPGGVGPMTVAYLLKNTVRAMLKQHDI